MKFEVNANLSYTAQGPSTLILNIQALKTPTQTVLEELLIVDPFVKVEHLSVGQNENRLFRLQVINEKAFTITYRGAVENSFKETDHTNQLEVPVAQLDTSILPYLYPSRYCQSDKLYRFAHTKFGKIDNPFLKVLALTDWIHSNVEYLSGSTNAQTSAYDTVTELAGVCRDFAHLGIALCRALTIPARYFTGYAYKLDPPDFHACFEAYIGNEWVLFDATRLVPLNGIVKIATGMDAAETAVASIFGDAQGNEVKVSCNLQEGEFVPFFYDAAQLKGISYQ